MDKDKLIDAAARFAQQHAHDPQPQAQMIQPQPVPMSIQLMNRTGPDGKQHVVLVIFQPTGQSVFFFDPDGAEQIANGLIDAARTARTGLEIPRLS